MSSSLFSILAQTESGTGSDWNWLLIFIIFVVVLIIALIIQARFSTQEAEELAEEIHHEEEVHHEEAEPDEPQVEPESEGEVPDVQAEADDFEKIEGIGPKVAGLLKENGITTFAQLSETQVEELTKILETAKLQMMDPASWSQQAKLAAAGEWDALDQLQGELKGGR